MDEDKIEELCDELQCVLNDLLENKDASSYHKAQQFIADLGHVLGDMYIGE